MLRQLLIFVLWSLNLCAYSQPKTLTAIKAASAPVIDGNPVDPVWKTAPVATAFIQKFPTFGLPSIEKTEVRILYDDEAIYVCAYLYDQPDLIRKQITTRDGEKQQDVDYFSVFFDTYNDQQNGFQFLVTSANVQSDTRIGGSTDLDVGEFGDRTWDAVWQSQVKMQPDGWTVEMRIPYLSLRFSKKEVQTWGLQFLRYIRRNNEESYWNEVDPNINGFANQFGKYADLKNIQPPLRLSFSPYLSGGVRKNPEGSELGTQWLHSGGMDVKYGLNESFTLDATLIPDFGQVVSDNLINNLSPFEYRFRENRPFFTEGTELFNKAGLFYSRRIGSTPGGYGNVEQLVAGNPNYELIRNPEVTQLYNGIKFSGRTKKKLGIGIFNAVTAPMTAKLRNYNTRTDTLIETEPLTNYNIIVLDQALSGRSSVTFTNTNVQRNGKARDANVSSFDWALYTKNNRYGFTGTARYSKIFSYTPYNGEVNLVEDTIRNNGSLYVNPYDGYNTNLQLGKVSGKLQYFVGNNIYSRKYDPNDIGFLETANIVEYNGGISYQEFTPTQHFITYRYGLNMSTQYLYRPYKFSEVEVNASALWVFRNFWDVTLSVNSFPLQQHDYFELRTPSRYLARPAEVTFEVDGSTDSRKRLFISYIFGYAARALKDNAYNRFQFDVRYRFTQRLNITGEIFRQFENNQIGYAFLRESDGQPIIGFRNYTNTQTVLSANYNFTSRLNLTLRGRHYWNKIIYNQFFDVSADGGRISRPFIPNQNINYNIFTWDAFLTWDFRLGSRLVLGWKNWLGNEYSVDTSHKDYTDNFMNMLNEPHGNELSLKFIYFLDYNQLRKKK